MIPNKIVLTVLLAVAGWRTLLGTPPARRTGVRPRSESGPDAGSHPEEMTRVCDSLSAWIHESTRHLAPPEHPWTQQLVARLHAAQVRRVDEIRRVAARIVGADPFEREAGFSRMREAVSAIVRDQRRKERILMSEYYDEGGSE